VCVCCVRVFVSLGCHLTHQHSLLEGTRQLNTSAELRGRINSFL
jgi:hypothetical protein